MTTSASTLLERHAAWLTSRRGFFTFLGTVLISLVLIRTFLFPGVGGDDGEQLVFSQYFSWGYQIRNPPLVTWLLIGLQTIIGPSVLSIVVLRMTIVLGIYVLSYLIATRLCADRRLAALSAGSLLMIFYMGWNTIHGFTHTSLVTAFYLAALLLILKVREAESRGATCALGLVLGLGLLAKYSFVIFALALLAAAMMDPILRRRLMSPWLVAGALVTLPLVVPQAQWLIEHAPSGHMVRGATNLSPGQDLSRAVKSIARLIVSIATFVLPLAVIWLAVFWRSLGQNTALNADEEATARLFKRLFVGLVVLAVVAIFVIKSDRLRSHYLFVLIPLVPYVFWRYGKAFREIDIQRFAAAISLTGIALAATLLGKFMIEPLICGHCEDHVPYDDFADQVREAGFRQGTVFAYFHRDSLAGNFRVRFPGSRIVSAKHPEIIPPARHKPGQCLVIWPVRGAVEPKSATIDTANRSPLKTGLAMDHPSVRITANLPPYGRRPHQLEFILLPAGAGACR